MRFFFEDETDCETNIESCRKKQEQAVQTYWHTLMKDDDSFCMSMNGLLPSDREAAARIFEKNLIFSKIPPKL